MVKKLIQQRRHGGDIAPRHHRCGRKPMILAAHQRQMRTLLRQQVDLTLRELRAALGLECSLQALNVVLIKMGLSYKKDAPRERTRSSRYCAGAPQVATAASRPRSDAPHLPG
jgi:transposase